MKVSGAGKYSIIRIAIYLLFFGILRIIYVNNYVNCVPCDPNPNIICPPCISEEQIKVIFLSKVGLLVILSIESIILVLNQKYWCKR
jgi:hypothetical protein